MFWEWYQISRINAAQSVADRADSKTEMLREHFRLLEDKIAGLALACQSLWEVIRDNTGITYEQLTAKMEEIDLRDGRADGKLSAVVETCSKCGRTTSRRRRVCLYCGAANEKGEVFGLR
jgi:hypothetical protein